MPRLRAQKPPAPVQQVSPLPNILRSRRLPSSPPSIRPPFKKGPWIIGGALVCYTSAYGFYTYEKYQLDVVASQKLDVPLDVSDRFNTIASRFDSDVGFTEMLMRLGYRRKKLLKQATGHVLEVSVGTGRNMDYYYPLKRFKTLTFVDQSPEMVDIAREKFKKLHPIYQKVVFRVQSASEPMVLPTTAGFDTIIQTMGLCSTPEPERLLRNLGKMVNQESGRILLLEHGRSHYAWVNQFLDNVAPVHADKYGCWWNKDIGKIVEESGLRVVEIKRYHFGTTWYVELRPTNETSKEVQQELAK